MANCFLVLGTPRSGTSLVAGILHHLGVRMGEEIEPGRWDWADADDWNAKGFFQDAAFVNFGFAVYGWPPPWTVKVLSQEQRDGLQALIAKRSAVGGDWGVKEPTIAYYLPEFVALCPDPVKLILPQRARAASILSWRNRTGDNAPKAAAVIDGVAAQVTAAVTASLLPSHSVQFNDLLDNRIATVAAIASFVGKTLSDAARDFPDESLRNY